MQRVHASQAVREEQIGFPTQYGPTRTDKKPGHALVPHEAYRDLVVILLMTGVTFILTALAVPALGRSANPFQPAIEPPDWYLLWTWGLLQIAELFPPVEIFGITMGTLFYGFVLTNIPIILLLVLPFIDKGFESRPAKAPFRTAVGVAGIAWVTMASIYSIRGIIIGHFVTGEGVAIVNDNTLRWMFIVQPVLAGMVAWIAMRRLAFKPMRRWNTLFTGVAVAAVLLGTLVLGGLNLSAVGAVSAVFTLQNLILGVYVGLAVASAIVSLLIVHFLDERKGRRALLLWITYAFLLLVPLTWYLILYNPPVLDYVQVFIVANAHLFLAFPIFAVMVAYFGQRTPYSDYEYKLNECYQCGRCHLVCPITKVDADALGGLNLVYNVYKRQHDGVPMWACLTCDACSAVCPLDIDYSAYVLTERARVMREKRRIPERPAATLAANGGRRR